MVAETGGLEVRVLWKDDRSPVAGFALNLGLTRTHAFARTAMPLDTGPDGIARVDELQPGVYWINATKDIVTSAEIAAGETEEIEVLLERYGHLRVQVVDEEGEPIPDADVHAVGGWLLAQTYLGQTDPDGRFEFDAMGPNVSVYADKNGRGRSESAEIVSFPGDTMDLTLTMGLGARNLHGLVTDEARRPVAGAQVTVWTPLPTPRSANINELTKGYDDNSLPVVTTNEEGRFQLGNVLPGTVRFEVQAAGFAPKSATGVLPAQGTGEIEIVLDPGAQVVGVVRDAEGRPLVHATVDLGPDSRGTQPYFLTYTDEQGQFRIGSLNPGRIHIRAGHPDHGEARGSLDVLAGETRSWDARLEPGGIIQGRVVDETGTPLGQLTLETFARGQGVAMFPRVQTASDGTFRILGCDRPFYRLSVLESSSLNSQALVVLEGVQPDSDPLRIVVRDSDRPSALIKGRLVRPAGFESFPVRLLVSSEKAGWSLIQGVGLDGEFRIGPLVPGRYETSPFDYETPLAGFSLPEVDLGPGMEVDLGVVLIPSPTWLVVNIRYTDGVRVDESVLGLRDLEDARRRGIVTPWIRGSIRPPTYRPGRYLLSLQARHHLPWSREIELVAGQTTTVDAVVERGRACRISLVLPPDIESPESLRVALRGDGSEDDRMIELLRGKRSVTLRLGSYVAEIQDEEIPLTGSVRFVVGELAGPELAIQLPAR